MMGVGVGVFFIALTIREGRLDTMLDGGLVLDWDAGVLRSEQSGEASWSTSLAGLAAYLGCLIGIHVLRVARWSPLLAPLVRLPPAALNRIGAVGFMAVFLLPFRLGEAVRPWLLSREAPEVPFSSALGTIVLERIADGLTVTALLFVSMLLLPPGWEMPSPVLVGAWSALGVFVAACVFIGMLHHHGESFIQRTAGFIERFSESGADRIRIALRGFHAGLAALPDWSSTLPFMALTALYWGLNGIGLRLLSEGFGLDFPLTLCFIMMACVVVGMMIPNSPGNVGTYWYFLLLPLASSPALETLPAVTAFGFTAYAMQLLQQSSFGLFFVAGGRVKWKTLQEATEVDIHASDGSGGTTA